MEIASTITTACAFASLILGLLIDIYGTKEIRMLPTNTYIEASKAFALITLCLIFLKG